MLLFVQLIRQIAPAPLPSLTTPLLKSSRPQKQPSCHLKAHFYSLQTRDRPHRPSFSSLQTAPRRLQISFRMVLFRSRQLQIGSGTVPDRPYFGPAAAAPIAAGVGPGAGPYLSHMETVASRAHPDLPRLSFDLSRNALPTVGGGRYAVWEVLELLASGRPKVEWQAEPPELTAEDTRTCLLFAAERCRPRQPVTTSMNGKTAEEWEARAVSRFVYMR